MEDPTMTTPPVATPETQPVEEMTVAVPVKDTSNAVATEADAQQPQQKKRKADRRDKLKKTALCKHFDKPGGCPFPNCRFAHGRDQVAADETSAMLAAQRQFLREQVKNRTEGRFKTEGSGSTAVFARRGTMIERYYTQLFACDVMGKPGQDQYVHMHSNRLCVVGAAPSHPLKDEQITAVEFTSNVLDSRVSGKKKRGGQFLMPETILCHVRCASGASYALRSCIRGTLLEVNERMVADPTLLQRKPESDGYLVIVQPKTAEVMEIQESLLTKEEHALYRAANPVKKSDPTPVEPTQPADPVAVAVETPQ